MNHRNLRILAVCGALAAPALTSAPTFAQGQVIDAGSLAKQRQLFDQGNKLYDQGKLAEAEAVYLEAWKLKKSFDVAGNLGGLEADLKKWRQAAEFLSFAIREFPAGGKPGLRDALLKRLGEVRAQVGALRITVNRPGAEVFVDGTSIGLAPLSDDVYVQPGSHLVEVRMEGATPAQAQVSCAAGQAQAVPISVEGGGGGRAANKTVLIAGGVIFGVAAIAGGVFTGLWASKGSSAKSLAGMVPSGTGCPAGGVGATGTCASVVSALDSQATFGSVAVASFATAGAVGIATLIYGLAGSRGARTGLVVAPTVTAQGGSLLLNGSF
jgi:hypothetical protein